MSDEVLFNQLKASGNEAFAAKRYQDALALYEQAAEADPTNYVIYNNIAATHQRLEQYDKAVEAARKSISVESNNAKAHVRLGEALWAQKKYDEAKTAYEASLKIDPNNANAKEAVQKLKYLLDPRTFMRGMATSTGTAYANLSLRGGELRPIGTSVVQLPMDLLVIVVAVVSLLSNFVAPKHSFLLWNATLLVVMAQQVLPMRELQLLSISYETLKKWQNHFCALNFGLAAVGLVIGVKPVIMIHVIFIMYAALDISMRKADVQRLAGPLYQLAAPLFARADKNRDQYLLTAAGFEVMQTLTIMLTGGAYFTVAYIQYGKYRYCSDGYVALVFAELYQRVGQYTKASYMPAFVDKGFELLAKSMKLVATNETPKLFPYPLRIREGQMLRRLVYVQRAAQRPPSVSLAHGYCSVFAVPLQQQQQQYPIGSNQSPKSKLGNMFVAYRSRQVIAAALFLLPGQRLTPSTLTERLRATGSGSGGKGNEGNSNNKNGGNEDGKGNSSNEDEDDNDPRPEEWIVPRTTMFVLGMFLVSFTLYLASRPRGLHVGWVSAASHADEIHSVDVYDEYAQLKTDNGPVHIGLISDQHTQQHLDQLSAAYIRAFTERKVREGTTAMDGKSAVAGDKASADNNNNNSNNKDKSKPAEDKPATLPVHLRGKPVSQSLLEAFGVFAWIVPFIFFPVYATFLSQFIGRTMASAAEAGRGKLKGSDMVFKLETNCPTRFRDVAGMKEPKKEITEIVDFLRHPERYTSLGAKIPTGALLLGPPGTGKTLLAKAIAGESGVGFISVCGSDFVELYVGRGAKRVRELFAEARKQRCIVYIDEIDAVGLKRQGSGQGEKQEQEQTLNELLVQMDGFKTSQRGDIMVLASSNVAQSALDPALIRPGRFDRVVHVDTPVISERIDIFKVHLSKLRLTEEETNTEADEVSGTTSDDGVERGESAKSVAAETTVNDAASSTENNTAKSDHVSTDLKPSTPTSANTEERSLVVSNHERESAEDERIKTEEAAEGKLSFDFRSLLVHKSPVERALIDSYAQRMSNLCPGFVGADIANVCNEAAILAARENCTHVDITHLERSIDRVLAGIEQRSRVLSPFEKNVVAHHEAGHAVAGWFLNRADPLMKVSIVPRGGSALGYAQYLPNENHGRTAKEIRDSISVTLGGRIAEDIFFGHLSTGASDDLRKVGRMAYAYVASFTSGVVYPAPGSDSTRFVKPYGERQSNLFDDKAKQLVDEVYAETHALLLAHKDDMEKLAQHLLKHELLTFQDVVGYLGERKPRESDRRKGV